MSIEVKDLQVAYGDHIVIPCANLNIPKGKVTMFIGKNGCGKSTLLKAIARILPVSKGQVFLEGQPMKQISQKEIAKKIAILPQSPIVPEGISVQKLVSYGRFPYQKPFSGLCQQDYDIITWAMKKTGVYEWKDQKVEALSGGQRQRVWIALALAQKTDILLLDEPTTYLDIAHQLEILELLKQLNKEEKVTIVTVIHELNHAIKFGDHIIGMKEGHILFEGSPKEVIHQENLRHLYDIEATLIQSEKGSYPICIDYTLLKETK